MRVTVTHTIGDLARDLAKGPGIIQREGAKVVRKNTTAGYKVAVGISKGASGIHGMHLHKRLEWEMTGPLTGEFGYRGSEFVGGGFRHAPPNRDLPKAADIIGPKFADDAADIFDKVFWP